MNFSEALIKLKENKKLQRCGFNGKDMFIYYIPKGKYPARMDVVKGIYEEDLVPYGEYLAIRTENGEVYPWTPSQADLFAEDWRVIG